MLKINNKGKYFFSTTKNERIKSSKKKLTLGSILRKTFRSQIPLFAMCRHQSIPKLSVSLLINVKIYLFLTHFISLLKITFIARQYFKIIASNEGDVLGLEAFYHFLQLINNELLFCKQTL